MTFWLIAFLVFFPINSFPDPMQIDKPPRNIKFNLVIDIIAARNLNSLPISMDLDTFAIPRQLLTIHVTEPDQDFIMLDSNDFED